MKLFTNLPGSLRFLFDILRGLAVFFTIIWALAIASSSLVTRHLNDDTKLMITLGEVRFSNDPAILHLRADQAKPGAMELSSLQGGLKLDLYSSNADLVSALRWTVLPSMAVMVLITWVLFTALRNICANIERGDVFTEKNLLLVRRIGLILVVGSVASTFASLWASHVMDDYLNHHVTLLGTQTGQPMMGAAGVLHFMGVSGLFSVQGFVTGLLVLVISQAFHQGLKLKTENDLTV